MERILFKTKPNQLSLFYSHFALVGGGVSRESLIISRMIKFKWWIFLDFSEKTKSVWGEAKSDAPGKKEMQENMTREGAETLKEIVCLLKIKTKTPGTQMLQDFTKRKWPFVWKVADWLVGKDRKQNRQTEWDSCLTWS